MQQSLASESGEKSYENHSTARPLSGTLLYQKDYLERERKLTEKQMAIRDLKLKQRREAQAFRLAQKDAMQALKDSYREDKPSVFVKAKDNSKKLVSWLGSFVEMPGTEYFEEQEGH